MLDIYKDINVVWWNEKYIEKKSFKDINEMKNYLSNLLDILNKLLKSDIDNQEYSPKFKDTKSELNYTSFYDDNQFKENIYYFAQPEKLKERILERNIYIENNFIEKNKKYIQLNLWDIYIESINKIESDIENIKNSKKLSAEEKEKWLSYFYEKKNELISNSNINILGDFVQDINNNYFFWISTKCDNIKEYDILKNIALYKINKDIPNISNIPFLAYNIISKITLSNKEQY